MPHDLDAKIAARKARWMDFYDMASPTRFILLVGYTPEDEPQFVLPTPGNKAARIEWAWRKYLGWLERAAWLEDDFIPYIYPLTGTEIFAAAFGCPVFYPDDNMPFARPLIERASQVAGVKAPGLDHPQLAILFEIADELRRRAGPEAVMRMVDMQSPMDVAALIWEKSTFFPAFIEAPEAVMELAARVRKVQLAFWDEWFRRYGREYIAHYPEYYMQGGITLSEDEVGTFSPRMFEQFFLPELVELSEHFGGLGMHCCAHARHQWAGFMQIPNLRLINFVQPQALLYEAHEYFARHTAQMHNWEIPWEVEAGPQQFPAGAHIVLQPWAANREEALRLCDLFCKKFPG